MDEYGPLKIRFEWNDKGMMLHLGDNSVRWSNLVGEIVREFPMYYPSWHKIKEEKKAGVLGRLMQHFDLMPHIRSKLCLDIKQGIDQHMGSRSLAVLRDQQMESFATREYPSLILTFFDTHTYGGEFAQDEARVQYEEMLRMRDLGANTPMGVPYTKEQIMAMVRKGKQCEHIHGVGRDLTGLGRNAIFIDEPRGTYTNPEIDEIKEEVKRTRRELELLRRVVRTDDRMSQMLTQFESQPEIGGGSGSGSGGGEDDESGGDEDAGGDEDI
ncbi:hypothetical protein Tco_1437127 [Tanacetum coccineum]